MKSPKAGKAGKKSTTWDPVLYGGKVNKEEVSYEILISRLHTNTNANTNDCLQAKMLDRTVGKPEDQEQDNQLNQFVPDLNVVGKSSTLGQVCLPIITYHGLFV